MNLTEYEEKAKRTRRGVAKELTALEFSKLNAALGLGGEAGELEDSVKKEIFHEHPIDRDHIKKEVGDSLYYLVWLAKCYDLTLDECMEHNIEKLEKRYPDGFSPEASRNRLE